MTYTNPAIIDESSEDIFQLDQLERQAHVESLSGLIERLNGPFVIALDSPFGTGKTTFVHLLKKDLEHKEHRCIYFNAWKVDYATDPLVAMVASIERDFPSEEANDKYANQLKKVKEVVTAIAKSSVVAGIKRLTLNVVDLEVIDKAVFAESKTDVVTQFNKEFELLHTFRTALAEVVKLLPYPNPTKKQKANLVFFIDELDRCRPTFAIHLLERVKHLFDIENIVFILSINKKQIEASIKAIYGAEIDAPEYLRRFFNWEYHLPVADTTRYIDSLITRFKLDPVFAERAEQHPLLRHDRENIVSYLNLLANAKELSLSLRAIERCMTRLRIIMDGVTNNHPLYPVLVVLLIVLHSNKPDLYDAIVSGDTSPEDIMKHLTSLVGGQLKEPEENMIIAIHAYLLIADPDQKRAQEQNEELEMRVRSDNNSYVASLIRMKNFIEEQRGFDGISLSAIAKQVELVSGIRK